jgi:hypothetical protein
MWLLIDIFFFVPIVESFLPTWGELLGIKGLGCIYGSFLISSNWEQLQAKHLLHIHAFVITLPLGLPHSNGVPPPNIPPFWSPPSSS